MVLKRLIGLVFAGALVFSAWGPRLWCASGRPYLYTRRGGAAQP